VTFDQTAAKVPTLRAVFLSIQRSDSKTARCVRRSPSAVVGRNGPVQGVASPTWSVLTARSSGSRWRRVSSIVPRRRDLDFFEEAETRHEVRDGHDGADKAHDGQREDNCGEHDLGFYNGFVERADMIRVVWL